jgi:transcriptional regulator with XRE-family HTH domain
MGRPIRTAEDKALMLAMGQRLRWVRDIKGASQADMAAAIGLHPSSWSLYERGARWPDIFEAMRIVAKLQISIPYLLQGTLEGVERDLAIQLAAHHPELARPMGKALRTDNIPS